MQGVESSEEVQQKHSGRPPGEEAERPRQSEQQREAGDSLQVVHQSAAGPSRAVGSHVANLDQHNHKDLEGDATEGWIQSKQFYILNISRLVIFNEVLIGGLLSLEY